MFDFNVKSWSDFIVLMSFRTYDLIFLKIKKNKSTDLIFKKKKVEQKNEQNLILLTLYYLIDTY